MPPEARDLTWLLDMLQEAQRIQEAVQGVDRNQFLEDWRLQHIAARCIEVIGEAANRVSAEFQAAHPEITWGTIVGMRNVLIHQYQRVDYELVWDVIHENIPGLITQVMPLLPPDTPQGPEAEKGD